MPKPDAITREWMRDKSDDLAVAEGCYFDPNAGQRACDFIEQFCCQSKGKWAGKTIVLIPWQRDFLMRLFGWKRIDGTRRFRTFYVEIPKKNGKSTLLAGIVLYVLIADGEPGAEVYICAYDRSQAGIIFDEARRMVEASPSLKRLLRAVETAKKILYPKTNAILSALSADVPSKDGINASFTIFDELHRQRTPAMWEIMEFAGVARDQPIMGAITTAGTDLLSICYQQHEKSEKVAAGIDADTSHLGIIYAAAPDDDIESPATWRKANPSMGYTIKEHEFAAELKQALASTRKLPNFLRLRLNIWTQPDARFIARDKWAACGRAIIDPVFLDGATCYAGLDLASTTDLAALVLFFPDDKGGGDVLAHFWAPEDGAERRSNIDRVPYLQWAQEGLLTLTPGAVIDYAYIRSEIVALAARYDLRSLFADPWNARALLSQLRDEDGMNVCEIRQGFASLTGPTKELERLVLSGQLRHGSNALLTWCIDNAVVETDAAGNIKLSKGKSRERIDGGAALVNALAATIADAGLGGESIYETRGMVRL
ncbi:MAG: Terminase [Verrucomicrobiales bacterium]|nr:Terminase [Verrucomicrobiales bacterium]